MRSRLFALMGALVLVAGGLLVSASPAAANHCTDWNTHPNLYNSGYISFKDGTYIRTHPYTDCTAVGQGYPSQGIDVHCAVRNNDGIVWLYVDDKATGKSGWARHDTLNYSRTVFVQNCIYPTWETLP
jgi:hypothetical protein